MRTYYDRGSQLAIIIYAISPVSLFGCVIYFGPKFQIILNGLITRQRYLRKISSPMYLLLVIYSALALI
jgi:hypothetical protein